MADASATHRPGWLLCDFAGVLGLHQPEELRQRMAAVAHAEFGPFWEAYWAERQAYDAGDLSRGDYWKRVGARIDADWPEALIVTLDELDVESWLFPNRETLRVAAEMRAAGTRLAVLSNAPLSLGAALRALAWLEPFDQVIRSSEIRAAKPDPAAYLTALEILGATADEVVFVDDRQVNVDGAGVLGIRSVLFSDAARLRRDLLG
ncbi:HAD-IA family hydrolase [Streptomyces lutosisoli]|uniref:HAD-IA family hydrolase n=1 Tax=Streptomyces lutosisoli TaxID=2665721 RepID=A0ABW2VK06_9ACTN